MFGFFPWFIKVFIFIGVCLGGICLMKVCEKYDSQIMKAIKKTLGFIVEMGEEALLIILAILMQV